MKRAKTYRGVHVFVVVFDISKPDTFQSATDKWMKEVRRFHTYPKFYLVGNKSDLGNGGVKKEAVEKLKENGDLEYFEVSCKTGTGVAEMWEKAIEAMRSGWEHLKNT